MSLTILELLLKPKFLTELIRVKTLVVMLLWSVRVRNKVRLAVHGGRRVVVWDPMKSIEDLSTNSGNRNKREDVARGDGQKRNGTQPALKDSIDHLGLVFCLINTFSIGAN